MVLLLGGLESGSGLGGALMAMREGVSDSALAKVVGCGLSRRRVSRSCGPRVCPGNEKAFAEDGDDGQAEQDA